MGMGMERGEVERWWMGVSEWEVVRKGPRLAVGVCERIEEVEPSARGRQVRGPGKVC